MKRRLIFLAPLAILAMLAFIALGGFVVKLLWNWLTPPLFGWHALTFWQALALLALCRILFGGLGLGGGGRRKARQGMWERWDKMAPEEREKFRQAMRERCGFGPPAGENPPQ